MKAVSIPLASLILDYSIYPRTQIESANVTSIKEAMEAGAEIPPIVIEEGSYRIVDGFHRYTAARKVLGDTGEIDCIVMKFANEGELVLESARLNSAHGARLSPFEKVRFLLKAIELDLSGADIATALNMTEKQAEVLLERKTATHKGKKIAIKQGAKAVAGKEVTKKQKEGLEHADGMPYLYHLHMVENALNYDLIPSEDKYIEETKRAVEVMASWLASNE